MDYDTIYWRRRGRIRCHHLSLTHKMTFVLILCSVLIINLKPIRGWNYCEEVPCDFVKSTEFKLDNAKSELDAIPDLTNSVDENAIIVTEEFNPSIEQALTELNELLLRAEDLNGEDLIGDGVPETLFLRLTTEEGSCKQLEERYDKLLKEAEGIISHVLQLSNKEREAENLLQAIKEHSSNLMQALATTQKNSERLTSSKMTNSEFNRTKQGIIFQLNKSLLHPLLTGNTLDLLNLAEQLQKSYDINLQLLELSQEIQELRESLEKLREIGRNSEIMGKDIQAILASFNMKNKTQISSNNGRFAKTKNSKSKAKGLSVAEMIKSRKENELKNG